VLFFIKKNNSLDWSTRNHFNVNNIRKLKIDRLELLNQEEFQQIKKVGIKGGKKNALNPDLINQAPILPSIPANSRDLNLKNLGELGPMPPKEVPSSQKVTQAKIEPPLENTTIAKNSNDEIFFKFKKNKVIPPSKEHTNIKSEVAKNLGIDRVNSKASNISNFDIRIERPEGVSEDQLNSDEKAFYSFYKRTYMNYVSKLFATYEKVKIEKPGIDLDFEDKHLLIAKIDYDENGNIITIKILKSSNSDNVHFFFEEALKNLNIPNPPKIFIKKQKQFSIYYQVHIN
jgi:uncharacterized protein YuzE